MEQGLEGEIAIERFLIAEQYLQIHSIAQHRKAKGSITKNTRQGDCVSSKREGLHDGDSRPRRKKRRCWEDSGLFSLKGQEHRGRDAGFLVSSLCQSLDCCSVSSHLDLVLDFSSM